MATAVCEFEMVVSAFISKHYTVESIMVYEVTNLNKSEATFVHFDASSQIANGTSYSEMK